MIAHVLWVLVCGHVIIKNFHIVFFYRQEEGRLQDSRKTAGQEGQVKSLSLLIWFSSRDFGFSPVRRVRRVQDS